MTKDDRPTDPSQQDHGDELTIESSDAVVWGAQPKNAFPAKTLSSRRKGTGHDTTLSGNRSDPIKMDQTTAGFDVPVGDSGTVVQSAWRFGS